MAGCGRHRRLPLLPAHRLERTPHPVADPLGQGRLRADGRRDRRPLLRLRVGLRAWVLRRGPVHGTPRSSDGALARGRPARRSGSSRSASRRRGSCSSWPPCRQGSAPALSTGAATGSSSTSTGRAAGPRPQHPPRVLQRRCADRAAGGGPAHRGRRPVADDPAWDGPRRAGRRGALPDRADAARPPTATDARDPADERGAMQRDRRPRSPCRSSSSAVAICCYVAAEVGVSNWLVRFLEPAPLTTATTRAVAVLGRHRGRSAPGGPVRRPLRPRAVRGNVVGRDVRRARRGDPGPVAPGLDRPVRPGRCRHGTRLPDDHRDRWGPVPGPDVRRERTADRIGRRRARSSIRR